MSDTAKVCQVDEDDRMVFDADGNLIARAAMFTEELLVTDVVIEPVYRKRLLDPRGRRTEQPMRLVTISDQPVPQTVEVPERMAPLPSADAELYDALVLGTRDYVVKNGFTDVVIALSGGIDSTIVACVAVEALGADHFRFAPIAAVVRASPIAHFIPADDQLINSLAKGLISGITLK